MACIRCGNCCIQADVKWMEITEENKMVVMDTLHWFNLHRCDTNIITRKDGTKFAILRIPLVCSALDIDKDGKHFCKKYDTRPELCKAFLCDRAKDNKGTSNEK